MKLVVAFIRPEKYGAVQAALDELGITQLTLTEVWGQGHEKGQRMIYRGATYQDRRHQRLKLEVAVPDFAVSGAVEAIQSNAKTGNVGDGVVLVIPLDEFIRIRTGQWETRAETHGARRKSPHLPADRLKQGLAGFTPIA
jgi:nitrogen regulatory protein PII